jgi:hypothetical protein
MDSNQRAMGARFSEFTSSQFSAAVASNGSILLGATYAASVLARLAILGRQSLAFMTTMTAKSMTIVVGLSTTVLGVRSIGGGTPFQLVC